MNISVVRDIVDITDTRHTVDTAVVRGHRGVTVTTAIVNINILRNIMDL
jgi:hypothetical protein